MQHRDRQPPAKSGRCRVGGFSRVRSLNRSSSPSARRLGTSQPCGFRLSSMMLKSPIHTMSWLCSWNRCGDFQSTGSCSQRQRGTVSAKRPRTSGPRAPALHQREKPWKKPTIPVLARSGGKTELNDVLRVDACRPGSAAQVRAFPAQPARA